MELCGLPQHFPRDPAWTRRTYTPAFLSGFLKGLSVNNAVVWVDGFRPDSISSSTGLVTNYMPGYIRLDFGAAYQAKVLGRSVSLSLNVRNAADKKIMEGLQTKGDARSWRLGVGTRF